MTGPLSASPEGQDFLLESAEDTFEVSADRLARLRFNETQGDSASLEFTSVDVMLVLFGAVFEYAELLSYKKSVGR